MSYPYYRFFPGDYARDTRGLTFAQHGAYRLLLDLYYSTGKLQGTAAELARMLGARNKGERDAIELILKRYFECDSSSNHSHKRVVREIARMEHRSRQASDSVKHRWNERNTEKIRPQYYPDLDVEPEPCKTLGVQDPNIAREQPIKPGFEKKKKGNGFPPLWDRDETLTLAMGQEYGLQPYAGEEWDPFRARIRMAIAERKRG